MIVFLYGRDGYRLKQNLDRITTEYRKKNTGMSFSVLDGGADCQDLLQRLEDLIKTVSFFDEKKLIVLKNVFLINKGVIELVKRWGVAGDKERVLVFIENSGKDELVKKDRGLFNLLSTKPNIVKSFEPLEGKRLENWAKEEIESFDVKIEPAALKKLISCTANSDDRDKSSDSAITWRLKQEISKLISYKSAVDGLKKNNLISAADVELMVGPGVNLNVFEVVDAIADKNQRRSARMLFGRLETGVDPYYIFSMIVYQFRNLLRIKTLAKSALPYAGIVKKTGLHPYVVKKTLDQCRKFGHEELKRLFNQLARLDEDAKSGKTDMVDGLYNFVFSLSAPVS